MLSGIDLVAEQIRIAAGEPLGYGQDGRAAARATPSSSASTRRTCAHDFRPQVGMVARYLAPGGPGVRMDSHLYSGYEVPPYYDSLLGKLIVWGPDRDSAIERSRVALEELVVDGLVTNVPFHRAILDDPAFLDGCFNTNLLDRIGSGRLPGAAAGDPEA